jgi:hypothetical protein
MGFNSMPNFDGTKGTQLAAVDKTGDEKYVCVNDTSEIM